MKENQCRIIKIEKDALYEFIYENFIANHQELMDEDAVGNMVLCQDLVQMKMRCSDC